MTDITDQELRDAIEWGRRNEYSGDPAEANAAIVILATVDAPATTLPEDLRHIAEHWEEWATDTITSAIRAAADRAEQVEKERDEARAEVNRLTAERDEARDEANALGEELAGAESEVERLTAELDTGGSDDNGWFDGMKEAARYAINATRPDPADVKPGEAWIVECDGEKRAAVKDKEDALTWNTVTDRGLLSPARNSDITLLYRLGLAPRVITNPDELERLAATSIIRDGRGWPGGVTDQGVTMINGFCVSDEEVLGHGPVTVLWEPATP